MPAVLLAGTAVMQSPFLP